MNHTATRVAAYRRAERKQKAGGSQLAAGVDGKQKLKSQGRKFCKAGACCK